MAEGDISERSSNLEVDFSPANKDFIVWQTDFSKDQQTMPILRYRFLSEHPMTAHMNPEQYGKHAFLNGDGQPVRMSQEATWGQLKMMAENTDQIMASDAEFDRKLEMCDSHVETLVLNLLPSLALEYASVAKAARLIHTLHRFKQMEEEGRERFAMRMSPGEYLAYKLDRAKANGATDGQLQAMEDDEFLEESPAPRLIADFKADMYERPAYQLMRAHAVRLISLYVSDAHQIAYLDLVDPEHKSREIMTQNEIYYGENVRLVRSRKLGKFVNGQLMSSDVTERIDA